MHGALVLGEIAGRVRGVRRRFAEHVVREGEALRLAIAAVGDRLPDRAPGDELLAHEAHRDVDAAANDRLAAAGDEARQGRRQTLLAGRRHQAAGQHQAPRRGVDEQRRAVAEMGAPVARGELVADQGVAGGGVGNAQQRLGEAHQRHPLLARQRIFVDQALDAARARLGPQAGDETVGERLDPFRLVGVRSRHCDERRQAFGFRAAGGGGDRGPQRRLREDVGAERGEDVGGVGHDRLPKACPRSRPANFGRRYGNPIIGKGVLPMPRIRKGLRLAVLPFAIPGTDN